MNELARSRPSDVMSRYSTSAKNFGSTQIAFGFLIGFVSFDLGLTTVSSGFLTRSARADLAHIDEVLALPLAEIKCGDAARVLDKADNGESPLLHGLDLQPVLISL